MSKNLDVIEKNWVHFLI